MTSAILQHPAPDLDGVRDVLHLTLGVDRADIQPHHRLALDLNCDELDLLEIALALEERFGTLIPDDAAAAWTTVQDVLDALVRSVAA